MLFGFWIRGWHEVEECKSIASIAKKLGYDFLELQLDEVKEVRHAIDVAKLCEKILKVTIAHLPEIDFSRKEIELCKDFIRSLSSIGIKKFVFHFYSKRYPTKAYFKLKLRKLKELERVASSNESIILLENTDESLFTLKRIFQSLPKLRFCLDVGHANLFTRKNKSIKMIEEFKEVLQHMHVHDNFGGYSYKKDLHLPPGTGRIDFFSIFKKLKEVCYEQTITIEMKSRNPEYMRAALDFVRRVSQHA